MWSLLYPTLYLMADMSEMARERERVVSYQSEVFLLPHELNVPAPEAERTTLSDPTFNKH